MTEVKMNSSFPIGFKDALGNWKIHVLCWFLFVAYELGSLYLVASYVGAYFALTSFYLFYICLFYLHALVVLPYLLERCKRIELRLLLLLLELLVFVFLSTVLTYLLQFAVNRTSFNDLIFDLSYFGNTIFRVIYFMLYSTGYYFLIRFMRSKQIEYEQGMQVEQLRIKLLQAEVNYLRARINPHLLFNSLSFIKSAIKHSPANADEAIILLSRILDFSLHNSNLEQTLLIDEVKQVENLIRLNELRVTKPLGIRLIKNIDEANVSVIPIVLLTLVENIFKHGQFHDHNKMAEVYVEANGKEVIYRTTNFKKETPVLDSHGSGLENIKLRLEKSFPNSHKFTYGLIGDCFHTEVVIHVA